jgi:hypothetical protein
LQQIFPGNLGGSVHPIPDAHYAPSQSGKYVFQTTMIESGWFESVKPEILHKFDLTVVAYENKPVAFPKTEA